MQYNHFIVECPRITKTNCGVCLEAIHKTDIRIKIWHYEKSEFYHLECYKPKLQQYISSRHITSYLKGEYAEKFQSWLNEWNLKFPPLDKPSHFPPKLIKHVESQQSRRKRSWLEIFKFLRPREVLNSIAFVNKEFYHLTWDQELWRHYCIIFFDVQASIVDWRAYYCTLSLQACFGCKAIIQDSEFHRCPLLNKPLCKKCRRQDSKFKVYHKNAIFSKYGINPNVLNLEYVPGFNNRKVTYHFMIEKALYSFREKNKEVILAYFRKLKGFDDLLKIVEEIDLANMDAKDNWHLPNYDQKIQHSLYPRVFNYIRSKEGGLRSLKGKSAA
ncbi:unnamed protein product [Blepharisma stoltei]|uniref:F-box domain-containing protein n=1 Tax=Blepharisma stoltei TaxID=1481888 RepID=A0AAU9JTB5_9CILI|nr:unnamed protein product [Blepharisma stoltei]